MTRGQHTTTSIATGGDPAALADGLKADARFKTLVEQLPAITYIAEFSRAAHFVYVSPQIEKLLGFPPQDWIDQPDLWEQRLHPEDRARVVAEEQRTYDSQETYEGEFRMVARDGRVVWFVERDAILRDAAGQPTFTQGVLFDVTELRAAQLATKAERDRAESYLEVVWTLVLGLDTDGRVTLANRRVCEVLGYEESELIGRDWLELALPASVRPAMREGFERAMAGGSLDGEEYTDVPVVTRGGEERMISWHTAMLREDGDRVIGMLCSGDDVTVRRRAAEQIAHLAYHDQLTGLPNRAQLSERLRESTYAAEESGGAVALLCLDLDDFKLVNDGLGHEVGDRLLCAIAGRLEDATRHGDLLVRPGGDEFMLLLPNLPGQPNLHASAAARRMMDAFDLPFEIGGAEFHVSASIGVSVYPADAPDADALLRHADHAMYLAKQSERAGYAMYEADDRDPLERLSLTARLRRGVERGELLLHYQAIYSLTDGAPIGFEALVRWNDPERGLVPPMEFIPAAENSGLIEPIGAWVVGEACRQLAEWRRLVLDPSVSVNASPRELRRPDFVRNIAQQLRSRELPPPRLTVEITESAAMREADAARPHLEELASLGVEVAIDDFGEGFSSLGRLRRMPVGQLKIDRSFMLDVSGDEGAAAVVTAVVGLGRALGCRVVAEGVETPEQRAFLCDIGCGYAQGFHLARPMPAAEATALLLRSGI